MNEYTKEEAMQKWCLLRKGVFENHNGDVICGGVSDTSLTCISDDCMMWKWATEENGIRKLNERMQSLGYCGLCR